MCIVSFKSGFSLVWQDFSSLAQREQEKLARLNFINFLQNLYVFVRFIYANFTFPRILSLCLIEIWAHSPRTISENKEGYFDEPRNLDAGNVLPGHCGYGTLFPLYNGLRENMKMRWIKR